MLTLIIEYRPITFFLFFGLFTTNFFVIIFFSSGYKYKNCVNCVDKHIKQINSKKKNANLQ